jgi:hypothetical protein
LRRGVLTLAVSLACISLPTPALAQTGPVTATETFSAEADSYVASGSAGTNFGSAASVIVDGSPRSDGFVRFRVEGLAGVVTQARLRLHVTNGSPDGPLVYATSSEWSESLLTWGNRPAPSGAPLDDAAGLSPGTWADYDVSSLVGGDGVYSFNLVPESSDGVDFVSRESTSAARPQLVVDTEQVGPQTQIDAGPSGTTTSTTASFGFSSPDPGARFECRLDGGELGSGTFSPCSSPENYVGLAFGQHTFEVRAVDGAGIPDPTPAARTWTIGSTATTSFDADADAHVASSSPASNFGAASSVTVDRSPVLEGFLRFSVEGLSGEVTDARLRLYATNGSPDGPALAPTSNGWSESQLTWSNQPAATGPVAANVGQVGAGAWAEYDVGALVTGDGIYSFNLAAESSDGVDFVSRQASSQNKPVLLITTKLTGPEARIDSGPSGSTTSSEANFGFSASDPNAGFECRLDAGAWAECRSPQQYIGLGEGPHAFEVRAIGQDGLAGSPASRSWTVDATAPAVSATTPGAGASGVEPNVMVSARFSEAIDPATLTASTFTLRRSGESTPLAASVNYDGAAATATLDPAPALAEGSTYTATLRGGPDGVKDVAGNPLAAAHSWSFTTAAVPPQTTIDSGPSGSTTSTSATFTFSASEPGASFECKLDAGSWKSCQSPAAYSGLAAGEHSFEVRASDAGGAADPTPASRHWTVVGGQSVLWAVGDANDGSSSTAVASRISGQIDRFLYLGDVYQTGTAADFANNFNSVWGRFKAIASPTPADQDFANAATGYDPYWGSRAPQTNGGHWYSVSERGWTILSLNSEEDLSAGSAQYRWLEQQLAGGGNCRILLLHKPRYRAGSAPRSAVEEAFDLMADRVLFVLSGHAHNMQRAHPVDGVTQFIAGAGGAGLNNADQLDPEFAFVNDSEYGILRIALTAVGSNADGGATAEHRFIAADNGVTLDSGSRSCTPASAEPPPPPGTTHAFAPEADAHVLSDSPNTNYGAATALSVDRSPLSEAFLRFRVEGISGQVTQAKLRLFATNGSPDGPVAYPTSSGWPESQLTWNIKPAPTGSAAGDVGQVGSNAWAEYDVTSLVTGEGVYSFDLVAETSDGVVFTARESASQNKPQLVVTTGDG